jgi:hypothetical protein
MADTILSSALTYATPDPTKVIVFGGGTIGFLADLGTYPTDLKLIKISKFSISCKVETGSKKTFNVATKLLNIARRWTKSVEYSGKATTPEAGSAWIATLIAAGSLHGRIKVMRKDVGDDATHAKIMIGECLGTISIDGDIGGDDEESPDIDLAIEFEGVPAYAQDAVLT